MFGQIKGKVEWKVGGEKEKWKRKMMQRRKEKEEGGGEREGERRRKEKSGAEAHGLEKVQVLRGLIRCGRW